MKKHKNTLKIIIALFFMSAISWSNNLHIDNVVKVDETELQFNVSWDNSWNSNGYHDAVWIFVKAKDNAGNWIHVDITAIVGNLNLIATIVADSKGIMLKRSSIGTGTISDTINFNFINANLGAFPDFKIFGIEMVYINEGAFYLGDGVSTGRFVKGDDDILPYHVQHSNLLTKGNSPNDINSVNSTIFQNILATYPTGYDSFYLMKYEASQEQYVEFLNTLTITQQQNRTRSDLTNISLANRFVMANNNLPNRRNGIACNANTTSNFPITFYCDINNNSTANEVNDGQNIAAGFITFNDNLAYLEWASLRPITDMEFEKATRGPVYPIAYDIANGTNSFVSIATITNSGSINETVSNINTDGLINVGGNVNTIRVGALSNNTSTRLQSGGSYYGVMDLTGNLNELVIYTSGASTNYTYLFGTGELNNNGNATLWNDFLSGYMTKGGSYWGVWNDTQTFSNSRRGGFSIDYNGMNNFSKSAQGIRGAR